MFAKKKTQREFNFKRAVFWGIFPDLFAFLIPIMIAVTGLFFGKINVSDLSYQGLSGSSVFALELFQLVALLYSIAHSLVVFVILFVLAILWNRVSASSSKKNSMPWEMFGWALHIFIDIPTHSTDFFATPFLWPISDLRINGISWRTPWLFATDYLVMFGVYYFFLRREAAELFKEIKTAFCRFAGPKA